MLRVRSVTQIERRKRGETKMRKLIATLGVAAAIAIGAACGTNGSAPTSAQRHASRADEPITVPAPTAAPQTVPSRSADPLDGYTWDSPVIRLIVGREFPASLWDQSCVFDRLEGTYSTPSAFSHDFDLVGADAVVAKTGVQSCYGKA